MIAAKIEKDIPIPSKVAGRPWQWPFPLMEIGDSFAAPFKKKETSTQALRRVDYIYAGRALDRKFSARTLVENGKKVVRIWRTK